MVSLRMGNSMAHSDTYEQAASYKIRAIRPVKPFKKTAVPSVKPAHSTLSDIVVCPLCNRYVPLMSFRTHIVNDHNKLSKKEEATLKEYCKARESNYPPKATSSLTADMVVCKKCGKKMAAKLLKLHLEKNHIAKSKKARRRLAAQSASNRSYSESPTASRNSQKLAVVDGMSKKLDATFGNHVIRDNGRFGSHPSHDGFDDESGA